MSSSPPSAAKSTSTVPDSPRKRYSRGPIATKAKGGNIVDTFKSVVDEVLIHVFTKQGKPEAAFTNVSEIL